MSSRLSVMGGVRGGREGEGVGRGNDRTVSVRATVQTFQEGGMRRWPDCAVDPDAYGCLHIAVWLS